MTEKKTDDKPHQTSFRFRKDLWTDFERYVQEREQKGTPVLEDLMRLWIVRPELLALLPEDERQSRMDGAVESDTGKRPDEVLLREFVRWVPAVVIVKELQQGCIMGANEGFLKLVKREDVIGLRAHDYLTERVADAIADCDRMVREERTALVCAEHITVGGEPHKRITIRFPIRKDDEVIHTGTLGFNVDDVQVAQIDPANVKEPRARRFSLPEQRPRNVNFSTSLLNDFARSLPAIATVKNKKGQLLYVNDEYERVTGKTRNNVSGQLPTAHWPELIGRLMMTHDQLVRDTQVAYVTLDVLDASHETDRVNIRFPIFDLFGNLIATGSFGFHRQIFLRGLELVEDLPLDTIKSEALAPRS